MKSRFQILGHPIHVMIVSYPIALYGIALLCDLIYLWGADPFWYRMAFWTMLFGLIGNLLAIFSGIPDLLALRKEAPDAARTGTLHAVIGSVLVAIYLASLFLRNWGIVSHGGASSLAVLLNLIGAGVVGLQGWFGGELVYRHRIGIGPERK